MHRFSRRQFITTALASAVVTSCTGQKQSQPNAYSSTSVPSTPATRIVALEWVYVEDLLSLGIQPVGVADIRGYRTFVDVEPRLAETIDVGTRQEPSLEAIAQLEPDLIIGTQLRHEAIYDPLSAIAPTLLFNPYPDSNVLTQFDEMQQTFKAIAERVNRRDAGETVLQQMQNTFKAASDRLRSANQTNNPFILGQFNEATPQIRLFSDNAIAVQVLRQIGLENAWKGQFDRFGFNTVGIEAFPSIEQASFLYIAPGSNMHLKQLQNHPVWKGLKFVQENRFHSIGSDTWVFGGPKSAQVLAEKVTAALTEK